MKADLWQAAVVAFLILMLDYSAEQALRIVAQHPVARPDRLNRDGGWFCTSPLKQSVVTQFAHGIVDSDCFLVLGFPKFDRGDGLVLGLMKSHNKTPCSLECFEFWLLRLLRPARGKVLEYDTS